MIHSISRASQQDIQHHNCEVCRNPLLQVEAYKVDVSKILPDGRAAFVNDVFGHRSCLLSRYPVRQVA